jgi:predicted ATPase
MRLDRLSIPSYRNLRSFEIDFDESQPTTVLLGRNGSGKSNLIEAIVEIFRELEGGGAPDFDFTLAYECQGHKVTVRHDRSKSSRRLSVDVDGKRLSSKEFEARAHEVLPSHVFGYYSGWGSRLERAFEAPTRKRYRDLLTNPDDDLPFRRFFFCRREYSQLALLAFFLSNDAETSSLMERYLDISGFESALFVLKKPWWGGKRQGRSDVDVEPAVWNAVGAFLPFLRRLWGVALAPIRSEEEVPRPVPRDRERTERIYLFVKDSAHLYQLKAPHESAKAVFGNLEALFLCDLVDEVRVVVRKRDGTRVRFTQLSEGEQQLLTVLGLLRFTQGDEALYLLDEPDTHLNPVWTYDFLMLLQDNVRAENGHLVVATHNPLMIGSLRKNQVRILSAGETGVVAAEPEYDPLGIGVEGLLKSEFYGLRSTLAPEVLGRIDRHYELLGKKNKTDEEQAELMRLASELNALGVARTHPNPYFEAFAAALARRAPHDEPALTKEELEAQSKLADEVLSEIIEEDRLHDAGEAP